MRDRASDKAFGSVWAAKLQGGESTLTDFLTKWQKGRRNHPFRQTRFQQLFTAIH